LKLALAKAGWLTIVFTCRSLRRPRPVLTAAWASPRLAPTIDTGGSAFIEGRYLRGRDTPQGSPCDVFVFYWVNSFSLEPAAILSLLTGALQANLGVDTESHGAGTASDHVTEYPGLTDAPGTWLHLQRQPTPIAVNTHSSLLALNIRQP
jgi:hypothetical protein